MGRRVEDAMLGYILQKAKKMDVKKIKGIYTPTTKNMPCEHFLSDHGFIQEGDFWSFSLNNSIKIPQHIKMISE